MNTLACDGCGCPLPPAARSYHLKVTVTPAEAEADPDLDPVRATAEWLQSLEESGEFPALDPAPAERQFRVCGRCQAQFLSDPFGQSARRQWRFSKN